MHNGVFQINLSQLPQLNPNLSWSLIMLALMNLMAVAAEPYKPANNETVLEKLPYRFFVGKQADSQRIGTKPVDPASLAAEVRSCLALSKESGDPRLLGHAQALLRDLDPQTSSVELLVLNAMVLQRLHDFADALKWLDMALAREAENLQALLIKAGILQVQGQYVKACEIIPPLKRHDPVLAEITSLSLDSLAGSLATSLASMLKLVPDFRGNSSQKQWMLGLAADMAERAGDYETANDLYRKALLVNPRDSFAIAAYADFLISKNRASEALPILMPHSNQDGLLLRHGMARRKVNPEDPQLSVITETLAERFLALRARGDSSHAREEAMFELHLKENPVRALELAILNWEHQREPTDIRLLAAAAHAAGDSKALDVLRRWIAETGYEDKQVAAQMNR